MKKAPDQANVKLALERVLTTHQDSLKTMNHWSKLAELTESTSRSVKSGRNTTIKTLTALANAAKMSLPELLEYGEPDWEVRVKARSLFRDWTLEELEALSVLLARHRAKRDAAGS